MKMWWMTGCCICVLGGTDLPVAAAENSPRLRAAAAALAAGVSPARRVAPRPRMDPGPALEETIHFVLHIRRLGAEPETLRVAVAHRDVSLSALAGMAEIDGNAVPILVNLSASLEALGDREYLVSYDFGSSLPVNTSAAGGKRSDVRHPHVGVQGSVRIGLNQAITILEDAAQTVSMALLAASSGQGIHPPPTAPGRSRRSATPKIQPVVEYPDGPPTWQFEVIGDVPGTYLSTWQDTGLVVRNGETIFIQADGAISYVGDHAEGPDGWRNLNGRERFNPTPLIPGVSFMALVGRVGDSYLDDEQDSSGSGLFGPGFVGTDFASGPGRATCPPGSGHLFLGVNDSLDDDNHGSFQTSIWVIDGNGGVLSESEAKKRLF